MNVTLDENELRFNAIQAGGPGGQNVNKIASAVELRFNVLRSPSLPEETRQRLIKLAGRRLSKEGDLVIRAAEYRTQWQNRQAALQRLLRLIEQASNPPVRRIATRPGKAARERRLAVKRHHSRVKKERRSGPEEW